MMVAELLFAQVEQAFPRRTEPTGALGQDTEALSHVKPTERPDRRW